MNSKRTVPVTIQGREYRVRAEGDAEDIERAAALLDQTMSKVRARSGTADSVDVAVLAALNLANTITSGRAGDAAPAGLGRRIEELADLVERATADAGPTSS